MPFRWLAPIMGLVLTVPVQSGAAEPVSIAVMEFASKGGVKQEQMDALSDLLAKEIESLGDFRVIGKSDISSMLSLEEQRQRLSSCDDQACLVEIGGALGVRWMVVGNVSLFGDTYLLNLKLIDVNQSRVAGRVSRSLTGGESQLISEVPGAALELLEQVGEQLGVTPDKLAEAKAAGERRSSRAEEDRQPPEALTGWFTRSVSRRGHWQIWTRGGGTWFAPGSIVWGDNTEEEEGVLSSLESRRDGLRVGLGGGYSFFDWLAVSAWIGYYTGSGRGDYEDWDYSETEARYVLDWPATTAQDRDLYRKRNIFEWGLEGKFSWPVDFWIEPVGCVSLGMSIFEDFIPSSYHPEHATFDEIPLEGTSFLLDVGVGVDVYILPRLRAGLMLMWAFRSFGNLAGDGVKWDAKMWTQGVSGAASLGWTF